MENAIGLERGEVRLVPYNPIWRNCFEEEKNLLSFLLGEDCVDIQHIGSTAIPGICAKPIIDIMAGINHLNDIYKYVGILEEHGYEYRGEAGVPGRILFAKGGREFRTHHLHVAEYTGEFWIDHILFRDYLLDHRSAAMEYEKLKMELARKFEYDRGSYTEGKGDFIKYILQRAKVDFAVFIGPEKYSLRVITMEDEDKLQKLCERCSDYYESVESRKCPADAGCEILTELPKNKDYNDKFVLGVFSQSSDLLGIIDVVRDCPVKGEWMIGLMMIDPDMRGRGIGKKVHDCLIEWPSKTGADMLRIGVVEDNRKAYSFWTGLGYAETKRVKMKLGDREKTVIVMNYDITKTL